MERRILLVLDLDETLMHAREAPLDRPGDAMIGAYHLYRRPHVEDLLAVARRDFLPAVWTSGGAQYAREVVRLLFGEPHGLQFIWSRQRCTPREDPETRSVVFIKDLKKVRRQGFSLDRVLVVDDSPEKLQRNYGNHIRVTPFEGDPADDELRLLALYLVTLRGADNVRSLEKRGWRPVARGVATERP